MGKPIHPKWQFSKATEQNYIAQLKKIAKHATLLITSHVDEDGIDLDDTEEIIRVADYYAESLKPWSDKTALQMINATAVTDANAWRSNSEQLGKLMKTLLSPSTIGNRVRELQARNVDIIQSIPREAALRVQDLALKAAVNGERPSTLYDAVMRTGDVTAGRAKMIARTEVANANASINEARATSVGIEMYSWETMEDEIVRPAHQEMQSGIFSYDDPPEVEGEGNHGPGQFPNCFPGSVNINNTPMIEKLYRRRYSGILTSLILDDGIILPSTPNHPILTINGFKAANQINIGDYIVKTVQDAVSVVDYNVNSFNVSFEQIFNALHNFGLAVSSRAIGGNFHGDIAHEEVDVISIDSFLVLKNYAVVLQKIKKIRFTNADMAIMQYLLIGDSRGIEFIQTSYPSRACFMSRVYLVQSLLISHFSPFDLFCFALGSQMSRTGNQVPSNYCSGDMEMFGDCIFAYAILIHGYDIIMDKIDLINRCWAPQIYFNSRLPDTLAKAVRVDGINGSNVFESKAGIYKICRVTDKVISKFDGNVYNLQTKTGYYMANTVLSSNCRCYASPVLPVGNS